MAYVGFVGYSDDKFDVNKAKEIIDSIFSEFLDLSDIIVSGGTAKGIPNLVYEKAKSINMETIGIMCKKGYDYKLFPVDKMIVVGDEWGEESQEFLSSIEVLFRIGGGKQSHEEVAKAKKMNIEVHEYELEAK